MPDMSIRDYIDKSLRRFDRCDIAVHDVLDSPTASIELSGIDTLVCDKQYVWCYFINPSLLVAATSVLLIPVQLLMPIEVAVP